MNIQKGDIIQLRSGRVCKVAMCYPKSAHIKCSDLYSEETFNPLIASVRKVLKRYAKVWRTRNGQFACTLIGDNGEVVNPSETYRTKAKAIKTVKTYHPTFKIIDLTK